MPKIKVEKEFPFSPDGIQVVIVKRGEQEVTDRLAEVAVDHLNLATRIAEKPTASKKTASPKASKE